MEIKSKNKYAYIKVASTLREKIISGRLAPGELVCSEAEICEQFGVSRGPVRQAMRSLVDEHYLTRVPGKGTFVRDIRQVRALQVTVLVDLLPENYWNPFLQDIIQGLRLAAKQMNRPCNLSFVFQSFNETLDYDFLNSSSGDGIIFVPINSQGVNFLNDLAPGMLKCKAISYYRKLENSRISQLYMDHETGSFRMIKYLLGQGHRRMLLLMETSLSTQIDSQDRMKGCLRAYKETGVDADSLYILKSGVFYESIAADLDRLLRTQKVEVLLVSGELLARNVLRFIESRKLKIPDDISIIFFDDCEDFKTYSPKLTAVRQVNSMGTHMALEQLLNELRNPSLDPIRISLKPELVIRDSCKTFI